MGEHSRLGFTQRDVDPLGRGDTAQRPAAEHRAEHPGSDGLGYGVCKSCGEMWPCTESRIAIHDAQASDLRKCDENTLRSAGR
jgi:hypothetical protein